jgi:hypothetical protein
MKCSIIPPKLQINNMMYLKIKNMFKMFDLRQFGKIKMVQIKLMLDEDNKIHLLHVSKY